MLMSCLFPCVETKISLSLARIRQMGLDKHRFFDYVQVQRGFIENEIKRWEAVQKYPVAVMDLGEGEIEFYTLNDPYSIGKDWSVEQALCRAVHQWVIQCMASTQDTPQNETLWVRRSE